ncbi:MAG: V-type ATP synthase subunit E family protein [Bacillota bacterium]|nr:V-type ATP synthase subunit E family protein [Bacillota bacterium]
MKEGAERIIQRILDDAGKKSDAIQKEAADKTERLVAEAEQKAKRKKQQILEQAGKVAEEHKRRIIGVAQLEARKELLSAKQDLIGDAFSMALNQLIELDEEQYLAVIQKMLLAYIEKGNETVYCSARDLQRIPAGFWKEVKDILKKSGKKGELLIADEPRDIKGGFILKDEKVEINCSFEALLEMKRDELEPAVAAVLFK